jgi:ferric-dicitrate binding protein FerR (iron transport regulator)
MSKSFNRLLAEMRRELGTEEARGVDWDAVDAALFARLDRERRAERARFAPQPRRGMTVSAAVLAAAAAVLAMLAGKTHETASADRAESVESAGTIVAIEGDGPVRVDGTSVASGAALKLGDVVETSASRATIERSGKLTMTVEPNSRTVVTHVRGALIVALEQGAVEAQVTPVPAGEAFAVDVGNSRVAVHGTRLRVARAGERVTVDLDEGVISVGEAPRVGSLVGTLVNAPAHVEFNAADALGTLTQSHDPDSVHEAKVQSRALGAPKSTLRKPESGADSRPSVGTSPELRERAREASVRVRGAEPRGDDRERRSRLHGRAAPRRQRDSGREHDAASRAWRRRDRSHGALRSAGCARREQLRGAVDLQDALRPGRVDRDPDRLHELKST